MKKPIKKKSNLVEERTARNKEAMYQAMIKQLGIVTPACEQANITTDTHYRWMHADPEYKRKIDALLNRTHDFVENALMKEIKKGSNPCIMFYLKTKGKARGYQEEKKIEVSGSMEMSKASLKEHMKKLLS